jgi:hypothetical protein
MTNTPHADPAARLCAALALGVASALGHAATPPGRPDSMIQAPTQAQADTLSQPMPPPATCLASPRPSTRDSTLAWR